MNLTKNIFMVLILFSSFSTQAQNSDQSIYNIKINSITNEPINLADYKGKKILFVNVASECGFTPQYKGLQQLYDDYQDNLMIIGVPCNQFGEQEPRTASEIKSFCEANYGVTFLITEKIDVKGKDQHPLYKFLTNKELNGKISSEVEWNFQKYLINENGNLVNFWFSRTEPLSNDITSHLK